MSVVQLGTYISRLIHRRTTAPLPAPASRKLTRHESWVASPTPLQVRRANIYDLPYELLYIIRDFIPDSHVYTHLALSLTCRGLSDLYDETTWQNICRAYGLGTCNHDSGCPMSFVTTWKELAYTQAQHANICSNEHGCIHFLAYNSAPRELLGMHFPFNGQFTAELSFRNERTWRDNLPLTAEEVKHRNLIGKGFRTAMTFDLEGDINSPKLRFYRLNQNDMDSGKLESDWSEHIPVACTFATDPPLKEIELVLFHTVTITIQNDSGVTVWDVISNIQDRIRRPTNLAEFHDLYLGYGSLFPDFHKFSDLWKTTLADLKAWLTTETIRIPAAEPSRGLALQQVLDVMEFVVWIETMMGPGALEDICVWNGLLLMNAHNFNTTPFELILLSELWSEVRYFIPQYLGFGHPDVFLLHDTLASFLNITFFCGLQQRETGSNVFDTIWNAPGDFGVNDLLERLQRVDS